MRRAQKRGREEELDTIVLDYFAQLHEEHIALANTMADFTRVLQIDWAEYGNDRLDIISAKIDEVLARPQRHFTKDHLRL